MSPRDLALRFLEGFATADLDMLGSVLHEAFEMAGPFFHGTSANAYLAMLRADPPDPSTYTVRSLFEQGDEVCVLYRLEKPGVAAEMAQWFRCEAGKVIQSRLYFDSRAFMP